MRRRCFDEESAPASLARITRLRSATRQRPHHLPWAPDQYERGATPGAGGAVRRSVLSACRGARAAPPAVARRTRLLHDSDGQFRAVASLLTFCRAAAPKPGGALACVQGSGSGCCSRQPGSVQPGRAGQAAPAAGSSARSSLGGPSDSIGGRRDQPAVGGDVGDPAVILGAPSLRGAGGPSELLVEQLTHHDLPGAASALLQLHTVDGVLPVRGDIGDAGVLVEAEVIGHVRRRRTPGRRRGRACAGSTGTPS